MSMSFPSKRVLGAASCNTLDLLSAGLLIGVLLGWGTSAGWLAASLHLDLLLVRATCSASPRDLRLLWASVALLAAWAHLEVYQLLGDHLQEHA